MTNKNFHFPQKLWQIVNTCKSGAVSWKTDGTSILINYAKFQREYLNHSEYFSTKNISSFIRQLNLYNFKKTNVYLRFISVLESNCIHEFQNDYFIRGREDLLKLISRKKTKKEIALFDKDLYPVKSRLLKARKMLHVALQHAAEAKRYDDETRESVNAILKEIEMSVDKGVPEFETLELAVKHDEQILVDVSFDTAGMDFPIEFVSDEFIQFELING